MSESSAPFVFMTCHPGAETALKVEVARSDPDWRLSFSRPGFLTFKHTGEPLDEARLFQRSWTFAHTHGVSLGRFTGSDLGRLAEQLWTLEGVAPLLQGEGTIADIHVWQRVPETVGDRELPIFVTPLAAEIERILRAAAPPGCTALHQPARKSVASPNDEFPARRRPAPRGGRVLDVILVDPGEWWVGHHRAVLAPGRWPGGAIPVPWPEHAVSRAYAKIEEALAWSGMPLAAGDECVEIGCAPGGASQALLDRGLFVTGIDPADVDPALLKHPRFRHLKKRGKEVRRREFLGVRWLVADMNIAPAYTLDTVEAIVAHAEVSIRGLILTLKLANWRDAEQLPAFLERVRGWGYRDVRARQLTTGGQEVCLAALRRRALRRLGGKSTRQRQERETPIPGAAALPPDPPA